LLLALGAGGAWAGPASSYQLYRAGRISEARALARSELAAAETSGKDALLWARLMHVAWIDEAVGQHQEALKHSNRALGVAHRMQDAARIGRSLSWIGWSYTSLGLYELALEFYAKAIELGTTEDGEVAIVSVWGLATQETGAIYARMGRLEEAAALIERTTEFARRHGIDVGVSEGCAHLAAIAIERGDLGAAAALAEESLLASLRCDCSPSNTARSHVIVARVALEQSRRNPRFQGDAFDRARAALEYAERYGDRRHIAEAQLVLSRALDPDDFDRRVQLVSAAVESLTRTGSELRGTAQAQLGQLFLERDLVEVAEGYLRSGLEINRDLFRSLDNAYVLADLGEVDALRGDDEGSFEAWGEAAARAAASGALSVLADTQERLSDALYDAGFALLAGSWGKQALDTLDRLLAREGDEESRRLLLERKLDLAERLAEVHLMLDREAPPGQVPG
jgi:tetratricopeptide (TPR) repeat protein